MWWLNMGDYLEVFVVIVWLFSVYEVDSSGDCWYGWLYWIEKSDELESGVC